MTARTVSICLAALLAGCAVGPNYRKPPIMTGAAPAPALMSARELAYLPLAPLPPNWWRLYEDPVLDGLVEKALVHNTDIRGALANLEKARAVLREAEAQRTPQTSLSGTATYGGSRVHIKGDIAGERINDTLKVKPTPFYDLTESVSYDLDLFGKLRRMVEEERANVGEAQAALDLTRVNTAASVAQAYSSICAAGLEIAVTQRSIAVADKLLYVTQRRFDAGVNGYNDVVQARQMLRQEQAKLPEKLADRRTGLFMLAVLTGDPPEAIPANVAGCAAPPALRVPIPTGDGAELLARRPDVREAERSLAAAIADIGVQTADLYPSVKLTGSLGDMRATVAGFVLNVLSYSVGSMISWTFPNTSGTRAKIAQSTAAARAALASFDGKVLTALRETESALVTLARQLDTERLQTLSRDDAALAYANARRKYDAGIGSFYSVLDAERTLAMAEDSLASATADVSKDQIMLFMALGGGWQDAPPVAETSLEAVTVPKRK